MSVSEESSIDWEGIRGSSESEWRSGEVVEAVFKQWCLSEGLDQAAVYAPEGQGWSRQFWYRSEVRDASKELERLPLLLDEKPPGARSLPGGLLLIETGTPVQSDSSVEAPAIESLLAAGVHLRQLVGQVKEQSFQEGLNSVKLEALYDVGLAIASTLNLDDLTESILMHAVSLLDARRGALFLADEKEQAYHLKRFIGAEPPNVVEFDNPIIDKLLCEDVVGVKEILPDVSYMMAVPIEIEGMPRGLLIVADKESRTGVGPFTQEDRRSLSLFASQAAIALENAQLHQQALEAQRLEREMELAAEIQRGILPAAMPQSGGIETIGWNRPTQQVGGDYYGSFSLGEGKMGLVVADVTGKGMPAALMVSTLHSALSLLIDREGSEEDLLARLSQHILDSSSSNKFITLILVEVDPNKQEIGFLNAGHNPGLLIRADGEVVELRPSGVPLGLLAGSKYKYDTVDLAEGDLLCLFSDGITECEAPDDEQYGEERLEEYLKANLNESLETILSGLDREVRRWADGQPQGDDQTVVLVRRRGGSVETVA